VENFRVAVVVGAIQAVVVAQPSAVAQAAVVGAHMAQQLFMAVRL
jgi:hypothetical protein